MPAEYFIERLPDCRIGCNIWQRHTGRYYNIATLRIGDPLCRDEWTVEEKERAVSYSSVELEDELEAPLASFATELAEHVLALKECEPKTIAQLLEDVLE